MSRSSTVAVTVGAVAVGLAASWVVWGVVAPSDTRAVAPVSVSSARGTADPSGGPAAEPSGATDPVVTAGPSGADDVSDDASAVAVPEGVTVDRARAIAVGARPGQVVEASLDDENGRTVWDVELRSTDGVRWEITVDAVSGAVLKAERS